MSKTEQPNILFTTQLSEQQLSGLNPDRYTIECIPFITFEYLIPALWVDQVPEDTDAWIFTSKKAVKALQPKIRDMKLPDHIFAVGAKTSEKLKALGLEVSVPEQYNAHALAEMIKTLKLKQMVHFCGNLQATDLSRLLGPETKLTSVEVYRTKLTAPDIDTTRLSGIVFMSPSAVESFASRNTLEDSTTVFCIGPTTEQAALEAGFGSCVCPEESTLESLIETIQNTFS